MTENLSIFNQTQLFPVNQILIFPTMKGGRQRKKETFINM